VGEGRLQDLEQMNYQDILLPYFKRLKLSGWWSAEQESIKLNKIINENCKNGYNSPANALYWISLSYLEQNTPESFLQRYRAIFNGQRQRFSAKWWHEQLKDHFDVETTAKGKITTPEQLAYYQKVYDWIAELFDTETEILMDEIKNWYDQTGGKK